VGLEKASGVRPWMGVIHFQALNWIHDPLYDNETLEGVVLASNLLLNNEKMDLVEGANTLDADDLSIDAPDAKSMVGTFLARSVVDEIQPIFYQHSHSLHKEYDV